MALTVLLIGVPSTTTPHVLSAAMTPSAPASIPGAADRPAHPAADDARLASRYLDDLKARYRLLDGVTVSVGTTPNGEEAVAYYVERNIVVSRTHTAAITTILDHEIWHIIDWRDNGRLDWGERLPPRNTEAYAGG